MQVFFYLCLIGFFVATDVNGDTITTRDCSCEEMLKCTVGIFQKRLCPNSTKQTLYACVVPEMYQCMKKEENCTFQDPDNFLIEAFERCLHGVKDFIQRNNITKESNMENGNGKASFYSNILLISVVLNIVAFAVLFLIDFFEYLKIRKFITPKLSEM